MHVDEIALAFRRRDKIAMQRAFGCFVAGDEEIVGVNDLGHAEQLFARCLYVLHGDFDLMPPYIASLIEAESDLGSGLIDR